MDKEKVKLLVLLLVNYYSKRGGTNWSEIWGKTTRYPEINKHVTLSIQDLLQKDKYIAESQEDWGLMFFITEEGKKHLNKELKKLREKDYQEFLKILPIEIAYNYRLYTIENTFFYSVFSLLAFNLTLMLIKKGNIGWALIVMLVSFMFIGLSIAFFSRIVSLMFYRFFDSLSEKYPKLKPFLQKDITIRFHLPNINWRNIWKWILRIIICGALVYFLYDRYQVSLEAFKDNLIWAIIAFLAGSLGSDYIVKKSLGKVLTSNQEK
ncbi:MAG: hypothetical protein AABW73_00460 [Nanoarchaeota archaeon]